MRYTPHVTRLMPSAVVFLLLAACAGPPPVRVCDPEGVIVDPEIVRIGSDDIMSASVGYQGCPASYFLLCGVDEQWLDRSEARLELWHDASLLGCDGEEQIDAEVSLRSVRDDYEALFGVDEATLTLHIGEISVDYSFAPVEPDRSPGGAGDSD